MDFFYLIGIQQVENGMKRQFEYADEPQPERPVARPGRLATTKRARLAVGSALYRLAQVIDPAVPVPSRPH